MKTVSIIIANENNIIKYIYLVVNIKICKMLIEEKIKALFTIIYRFYGN